MVSDEELARRLREFLRASDLSTTTVAIVRRQLEADFDTDLSDRKAFIREQVELFLQSVEQPEAEDEEEAEGEGEAEGEEDGMDEGDDNEQEDEEGEEEEEEGTSSKKRKSSSNDSSKKRTGFTKVCSLSEELQKFLGETELARTEVVKKMWVYIRAHNLQDPNDRRKIICDDSLKRLFNVESIGMFQMNKALTKHIWPKENGGPASSEKRMVEKSKDKQRKKSKTEGKKQKTNSSGSSEPHQLSDELVGFIGTGETMLSRSDVVKRVWSYIKEKNLQDPSNKKNIICDQKLKDLLHVDTFNGITVSRLLNAHFVKTSN